MKKLTTILCFGLLALLLTGAALDKYNVTVNGTGALLPPYTNFFDINRAHGSNAFSQTFGSSNAVYLLTGRVNDVSNRVNSVEGVTNSFALKTDLNTASNRLNSLEAVTNAFGDIITTDIADYATADQGAKADTAIQGIIVTGSATGETNGKVVTINVTGGGGGGGYAIIQDVKASGTSGGTFSSGAWRIRDLNTVAVDTIGGFSVTTNTITVPAGTYRISATAPAFRVDRHVAFLTNLTEATSITGQPVYSGQGSAVGDVGYSTITGRIIVTNTSLMQIMHRSTLSSTDVRGFGVESGLGPQEKYTTVQFFKE